MKFIISSSELLQQVGLVVGVVPAKAVVPIIQNLLFEVTDKRLTITATDLENTMHTTTAVEAEEDSRKVCLPAKLILDILKAIDNQPITITIPENSFVCEVTTLNGKYKISGENGEDFPRITLPENTRSVQMPMPYLVRAIEKTLFAASTDEHRPAMNGMLFNFKEKSATFVATDATRLVKYQRTDIESDSEFKFILPPKALKLLKGSASGSAELIRIDFNDRNAVFNIGSIMLVCQLIDDRYPEYEAVIPIQSPNRLIVNKKDFISSLKRLIIFANKTSHLSRFKLIGNSIELTAEDQDLANEAKETLHGLYEGEELEIGFNSQMIQEIITNTDTEDVILELGTPGRAVIILPTTQEANENVLMLAMPSMLNSSY
ncbi:MAG: DNA polymerase III subunit beta [Bacteroidia bacterium]|nr:DNA polymerase III subunit beta [Bacteroidia bacterium]